MRHKRHEKPLARWESVDGQYWYEVREVAPYDYATTTNAARGPYSGSIITNSPKHALLGAQDFVDMIADNLGIKMERVG